MFKVETNSPLHTPQARPRPFQELQMQHLKGVDCAVDAVGSSKRSERINLKNESITHILCESKIFSLNRGIRGDVRGLRAGSPILSVLCDGVSGDGLPFLYLNLHWYVQYFETCGKPKNVRFEKVARQRLQKVKGPSTPC